MTELPYIAPTHGNRTVWTAGLIVIVVLAALFTACMGGCSGITAAPGYATIMAQHSQAVMANAAAEDQPAALKANAAMFAADYKVSTSDALEWFLGLNGKKVLVTPAYPYLMRDSVLADKLAAMTLADPSTALNLQAQAAACNQAELLAQPAQVLVPAEKTKAVRLAAKARLKAVAIPPAVTAWVGKLPPAAQDQANA